MKKYLILGSLIVLAGIIINYSLGGFKPITPKLISATDTVIYGWSYEGSYSSDSLINLIETLRKTIATNGNEGTLTIVNFIIPELEKRGMVRQFVGIEWKNDPKPTKYKLDTLNISAYNAIQFRIMVKPLVMPSPEKLKNIAIDGAIAMDSELQGFSIEQYEDKFLILTFPLK